MKSWPSATPRHNSYKQSKSCLPLNKAMSNSGTLVGIGTNATKAFKLSFKLFIAVPMGPLVPFWKLKNIKNLISNRI